MDTIIQHFWIILIATTVVNGIILKYRSQKYIAENPDLKKGYNDYLKGWLFFGNIPWIIMAIGNLTGMTETTTDFFHPREMNPIVLVFHASIVVLCGLGVYWIYMKNGAEFIEKHPGLFQQSSFLGKKGMTAKRVKIFFPLMLFGSIMGIVMIWVMNIPRVG